MRNLKDLKASKHAVEKKRKANMTVAEREEAHIAEAREKWLPVVMMVVRESVVDAKSYRQIEQDNGWGKGKCNYLRNKYPMLFEEALGTIYAEIESEMVAVKLRVLKKLAVHGESGVDFLGRVIGDEEARLETRVKAATQVAEMAGYSSKASRGRPSKTPEQNVMDDRVIKDITDAMSSQDGIVIDVAKEE